MVFCSSNRKVTKTAVKNKTAADGPETQNYGFFVNACVLKYRCNCVCSRVHAYMCACMWKAEHDLGYHFLESVILVFFSDRVSHCLENSVHRLTWLTRETRGSTYSHLSSAGITSVCHQARGCLFVCFCFSLMCVLKIKLRYSFYLCMYVFICMHM